MRIPWLIVGGGVLLLLRCGSPNESPVVEDLIVPDSVFVEDTAIFSVSVSDPEYDNLSCEWKASGGRFVSNSGRRVEWIAEDVFETVEVEVLVTDEYGASDSARSHVRVSEWILAHIYSFEDEDIEVFPINLEGDYSISGWFEHHGPPIQFYVFDSKNYEKWQNEESYVAEVSMVISDTGSYGVEFGFIVKEADIYYFVIQGDSTFGPGGCIYAIATSP
jgi:hypothetical protein